MRFLASLLVHLCAASLAWGTDNSCDFVKAYTQKATESHLTQKDHFKSCEQIVSMTRGLQKDFRSRARGSNYVPMPAEDDDQGQSGEIYKAAATAQIAADKKLELSRLALEESESYKKPLERARTLLMNLRGEHAETTHISGVVLQRALQEANERAQEDINKIVKKLKGYSASALADSERLKTEAGAFAAGAGRGRDRNRALSGDRAKGPGAVADTKGPGDRKEDDEKENPDGNPPDTKEARDDTKDTTKVDTKDARVDTKDDGKIHDKSDGGVSTGLLVGLGGAALIGAGVVGGMYWVSRKTLDDADAIAGRRIAEATAAANGVIANAEAAANRIAQLAVGSANQVIANAQATATNILNQIQASYDVLAAKLRAEIAGDFGGLSNDGLKKYQAEYKMIFDTLIANSEKSGDTALASRLRTLSQSVDSQFAVEFARRGLPMPVATTSTSTSTATSSGTSTATATATK